MKHFLCDAKQIAYGTVWIRLVIRKRVSFLAQKQQCGVSLMSLSSMKTGTLLSCHGIACKVVIEGKESKEPLIANGITEYLLSWKRRHIPSWTFQPAF